MEVAWRVFDPETTPSFLQELEFDGHCHGKMVEAAMRRSRAGGSSRRRVLPLLCGDGPEQTHGAAGEEVTLSEKVL